jgi:hypothetical protein
MTRHSDERGIALILAVFALVIIGALIAGIFYTAQLEQRSGGNALAGQQAADAAQAGIDYAISNWNSSWTTLGAGNSATIASTQLGSSSEYFTATVMALNGFTYLVTSTGQVKNPSSAVVASRTMGMLFKKFIPQLNVKSAVTVSGSVDVNGSSYLNGVDANPAAGAWGSACGAVHDSQPGLRMDGTGSLSKPGNVSPAASKGDTSVASTMAAINAEFNALKAAANIKITSAPSVGPVLNASHACDETSAQTGNWGDPTDVLGYTVGGTTTYPCNSYFPIIYYSGSELQMGNAVGQGILLVDGDLRFNANFTFYGLIIVKGQVTKANGNSKIYGALVAQNANLGDNSMFNGNLTINYSSCAVSSALAASASGEPLSQRPFIQY